MVNNKKLLITGGAGYIGSHAVLKGIKDGYNVSVIDNLCRTDMRNLQKIEEITGQKINFYNQDLLDIDNLELILKDIMPEYVIHFAALKSVPESQTNPELYLTNNTQGTKNLVKTLNKVCSDSLLHFVFSSTAAVYGDITKPPIDENYRTQPLSAYGESKLRSEDFLKKQTDKKYNVTIFRYFNVIGNQKDGLIGEFPDKSTNLLPVILNVASGNRDNFTIFGINFDTKDGSQERDYIDVNDLIDAHFLALAKTQKEPTIKTYNLSTSKPTSCLEIHAICEVVCNKKIPYVVKDPRDGDPVKVYSANNLVKEELGWAPKTSVKDSVTSQWLWFKNVYNIK
jgi:UDP-glucose 4-epimerase